MWIVVEVVGGDDDARTHKKNSTKSQQLCSYHGSAATILGSSRVAPFTHGCQTNVTIIFEKRFGPGQRSWVAEGLNLTLIYGANCYLRMYMRATRRDSFGVAAGCKFNMAAFLERYCRRRTTVGRGLFS